MEIISVKIGTGAQKDELMEGDGGCTKWGKDCALGSSSIQGLRDEGELAEETERVARGQGEKPNNGGGCSVNLS